MFGISTVKIIDKFKEEMSVRNQKIKSLVSNIDAQLNELNNKMDLLTDNYVTQEIEGNIEALVEIDEEINKVRLSIEKLQGKKAAYQRLEGDDKHIKEAIPKVLESASKDRVERYKQIDKKGEEKLTLQSKIKELENKIRNIDSELSALNRDVESPLILPLLKYIEPRKIKNGFETKYISVLLDKPSSKEYLEQYIGQ